MIALKLLLFWQTQTTLWFAQAEVQFRSYRINSNTSKFNKVIGELDMAALTQVVDVVENTQSAGKYAMIKQRLLAAFEASDEEQAREITHGLELGHQSPTQLLRNIKPIAGNGLGGGFETFVVRQSTSRNRIDTASFK